MSDTPLYDAPSHAAPPYETPGPHITVHGPAMPSNTAPPLPTPTPRATEPAELPTHAAPAEDYDPSKVTTDTLAADVADEALEYPEGAPVLIPLLALPRMRRADAYEALGHISAQQKAVRTLDGEPVQDDVQDDVQDGDEGVQDEDVAAKVREIDPATYGAQYRVVAYVEQYLRAVAANAKAFDVWALRVSDADLITTFNVYLRKTQPGEAESSAG